MAAFASATAVEAPRAPRPGRKQLSEGDGTSGRPPNKHVKQQGVMANSQQASLGE